MMKYFFGIVICAFLINFSCTQKNLSYKLVTNNNYNKNTLAEIKNIDINLFDTLNFTSNGIQIKYRFLKPENITGTNENSFPLVIILHGSGEIGTNNTAQMGLLAKMWATNNFKTKYPAFIVVPQFPKRSSSYINDSLIKLPTSQAQPALQTIISLIDSLKYNPRIDTKRIYLVGFSMGASTAMNALDKRKDLFAAAVAFSGIPDFYGNVIHKPLWIIHGNADKENTFSSDSLFYNKMKTNKGMLIKFWEINNLKHEVPLSFITSEAIPKWLFKQKNNFIL